MKSGLMFCWRTLVGVGVKPFWRSTAGMGKHRIVGVKGGGPALWASGVSESRQWGAKGAFYLDACGRRGLRDERAQEVLRCISRSLVSAPAVHHRASRWRRPAAGWGGRIDLLWGRTNVRVNLGDGQLLEEKRK